MLKCLEITWSIWGLVFWFLKVWLSSSIEVVLVLWAWIVSLIRLIMGGLCLLILWLHHQQTILLHHWSKERSVNLLWSQYKSLFAVFWDVDKFNAIVFGHYVIFDELELRVTAQCSVTEVKVEKALNTLSQVFLPDARRINSKQWENCLDDLR